MSSGSIPVFFCTFNIQKKTFLTYFCSSNVPITSIKHKNMHRIRIIKITSVGLDPIIWHSEILIDDCDNLTCSNVVSLES